MENWKKLVGERTKTSTNDFKSKNNLPQLICSAIPTSQKLYDFRTKQNIF